MTDYTSKEAIIQNLKDAGCGKLVIAKFVKFIEEEKLDEELRLLKKHRTVLLNKLHIIQENISCLDYLIYHLKN